MRNVLTKWYGKLVTPVKNERGAQTLEWLGVAAVVISVVAILSIVLGNLDGPVGDIIDGIIESIMNAIPGSII